MKCGIIPALVLAVICSAPFSLGADKRPVVAVFDVNAQRFKLAKAQRLMLTELMAEELGMGGVFQVMPPGDVKKAILEQTRESYKECYNESCQIELGRQLSANKLLTSTVRKIGPKCRVTGSLYDLKRQTTDIVAREEGGCREIDLIRSVEKVAAKIRAWGSGGTGFKEEDLGEKPAGDWTVGGGREVIVRFESDPSGAVVLVDGNLVCQQTPCSKSVAIGTHTVAMQAPKYMKRQERKVLSEGGTITWGLEPNFGWLTVYSEPSGLDVTVNGTKAGRTPIERSEREPGVYRVLVTSPCHYNEGKKVKVIRGKEREVSVSLKEKQGAVRVKVEDDRGNDVAADVYIDGRKVGRAPRTFKVSVCAKELEVKHKKHGTSTKSLKILERKVTRIGVKLGEAIGDKKSIEKQMRLMKSAKNNNIKRTAIRALGRLKANEAVDDLIKILEDTSVHKIVRLNAVYALGEIGNPKAVKSLVLALYREKAYYFAQAGLALVKIGEPAVEPLVKTMFGKNNVAKSINKENVGVLAGALEANAAKVLGDIGSQSAVEPILKMAEKVDKWPEETNRLLVMARLINSLGSIGDKRALPLVYKYLEKELWDVRTICAVAINNIGDRSAVAEMLKFATTGQHPRTRAPLIEAIGNLATNEVLPQLQEMEKTQRDVTVSKSIKDSILRIKAYAQCKEDANCWIGKLVDKEAVVREKAAYELGRIGDQIAVDPLLKIINDRSENVRFAAIFAFDKLKSKKHIEAIEKLIKDEKGTRQYLVVNHNYKLLVARLKGIP